MLYVEAIPAIGYGASLKGCYDLWRVLRFLLERHASRTLCSHLF